MAVQIPVPDISYSEINITLSGNTYQFVFRFNERMKKDENDNGTWIIDIYDTDGNEVVLGLAVVGTGFLIGSLPVEGFSHGDIYCHKAKETYLRPERNNLGIDKTYQLMYLTNLEITNAIE